MLFWLHLTSSLSDFFSKDTFDFSLTFALADERDFSFIFWLADEIDLSFSSFLFLLLADDTDLSFTILLKEEIDLSLFFWLSDEVDFIFNLWLANEIDFSFSFSNETDFSSSSLISAFESDFFSWKLLAEKWLFFSGSATAFENIWLDFSFSLKSFEDFQFSFSFSFMLLKETVFLFSLSNLVSEAIDFFSSFKVTSEFEFSSSFRLTRDSDFCFSEFFRVFDDEDLIFDLDEMEFFSSRFSFDEIDFLISWKDFFSFLQEIDFDFSSLSVVSWEDICLSSKLGFFWLSFIKIFEKFDFASSWISFSFSSFKDSISSDSLFLSSDLCDDLDFSVWKCSLSCWGLSAIVQRSAFCIKFSILCVFMLWSTEGVSLLWWGVLLALAGFSGLRRRGSEAEMIGFGTKTGSGSLFSDSLRGDSPISSASSSEKFSWSESELMLW